MKIHNSAEIPLFVALSNERARGGLRGESPFVILRATMALCLPRLRSLFAAVVLLAGGGCGHPASEAECRTIVERIVDLELKAQKVTDPTEVAKRKGESLGFGDGGTGSDLLQGCIGKHITDREIECVRDATSASEITDRCLR
jgi:hypothetical protein